MTRASLIANCALLCVSSGHSFRTNAPSSFSSGWTSTRLLALTVLFTCEEVQSIPGGAVYDDDQYTPPQMDEVPLHASRSASQNVWIGHMSDVEYSWGESQCPLLDSLSGMTLEECKTSCTSRHECHAINYNRNTHVCEVMGCSQPVVTPTTRKHESGWLAFFLHASVEEPCHPQETQQHLDEGGFVCETGQAQVWQSMDPVNNGFCWDTYLPRIHGCWPGMENGGLRQFRWAIKLTSGWVDHYSRG